MNMDQTTIYVRALSSGEWYGGWAPLQAACLGTLHVPNAICTIFEILRNEDIDEDDEYEYWRPYTIVLCLFNEGEYRAVFGLEPGVTVDDIFPPMEILPEPK